MLHSPVRCTLHAVYTGRVLHMRAVSGTLAPARMRRPHASPAARRRLSVRSAAALVAASHGNTVRHMGADGTADQRGAIENADHRAAGCDR